MIAPKVEYKPRLERVRKRMKEERIGMLLDHSIPGSLRFGYKGHVLYLSGYEPYTGTATVILPPEENLASSLLIEGRYSVEKRPFLDY